MRRIMIQAHEELLERARRRAAERGVSIAQIVREALEKELGTVSRPKPHVGVVRSGAGDLSRRASEDEFEPEPWRSSSTPVRS
jgi:hypothetical protein